MPSKRELQYSCHHLGRPKDHPHRQHRDRWKAKFLERGEKMHREGGHDEGNDRE